MFSDIRTRVYIQRGLNVAKQTLQIRVRTVAREGFRRFLKKGGESQRVTDAAIANVEEFERYLKEQKGRKELDKAGPEDLDAFIS